MDSIKRSSLRVMVFGTAILGLAIGIRLSFGLFLQPMTRSDSSMEIHFSGTMWPWTFQS